MRPVVRLAFGPAPGGVVASVQYRDRAAVRTVLPDEAVEGLLADVAREQSRRVEQSRRGLLVPRQDAHVARSEQRIGRLLYTALTQEPGFAAALSHAVEASPAGPTALVVECADVRLRGLPWELLARGADTLPAEALGGTFVARLDPGPASEGPGAARTEIVNVAIVDPAPDAIVSRVVAALDAALAANGLPPRVEHHPSGPAELRIVHVIAHGEREPDLFRLRGGAGSGAVAALVQQRVPGADLVVASVCHAGEHLPIGAEELPAVFLQAGARACLAAAGPVRDRAVEAFYQGFFAALSRAADVPAAVVAGRRAVRSLALPHPDSRWHLLRLTVCDLGWLADPPRFVEAWRPAGWPTPAPDAAGLLQAAREVAEGWQHGYVGLEHLFLAIEADPRCGVPRRLRHLCAAATQALGPLLHGLSPQAGASGWRASPRLRGWADRLEGGFDARRLGALILEEGAAVIEQLLGVLAPRAPVEGELTEGRSAEAGPVSALECLGGPEDGRRLALSPDLVIGRWSRSSTADVRLYEGAAVTDAQCSRAHLRWLGAGRLEYLRPGNPGAGVVELAAGACVRVGRVTRLLAVAGS